MTGRKRQAEAGEWTRADVVAWLAEQGQPIEPSTWSAYVARGEAPDPVRYISRTPVWDPPIVRAWHAERPSTRRQPTPAKGGKR